MNLYDPKERAYGESESKQNHRAWLMTFHLQPCQKFKNVGTQAQIDKLYEEFNEVVDAEIDLRIKITPENREHLAMEIADVMVCCTTMLDQLGLEPDDRERIYDKVYQKNKARGYYNDDPNREG